MAATPVVAQKRPHGFDKTELNVTMVAADAVNGNSVVLAGEMSIVANNTDTTAHNLTITSQPDEHGRSGSSDDSVTSIPAGGIMISKILPHQGWTDANGNAYFTAASALVKVAVIQEVE